MSGQSPNCLHYNIYNLEVFFYPAERFIVNILDLWEAECARFCLYVCHPLSVRARFVCVFQLLLDSYKIMLISSLDGE